MKGIREAALAGGTLLAVACSGGKPGSANGPPDGGMGAPGAVECYEDTYCRERAEAHVAELGMTAVYVSALTGTRCDLVGIIAGESSFRGMACVCEYQGGGTLTVGPRGCQYLSRSGACLFEIPDGPLTCEGEPPEFCTDLCGELETRRAADYARTFDAEVRLARCAGPYCETVLRVEDRCYPGIRNVAGYDCALTDEEILAAERARVQSTYQR